MEHIEQLLIESSFLKPIPTETEARYKKDTSIKAVVFDIYGTLLVSASGDIDQMEMSTLILKSALSASGINVNANTKEEEEQVLNDVLDDYHEEIRKFHEIAKIYGIPHPEVNIIQIWKNVLTQKWNRKRLNIKGDCDCKHLTLIFELLSNRVSPMPNLKDVIKQMYKKMPLGIVSNAQFYTPIVMNYFLKGKMEEREFIEFFDEDISVFSYKLLKAKPDTILYEKLIPVLTYKYKFRPEEVLFVGNDMLKDIYPANKVGFKTALFAGDTRSLRLREDREETKNLQPDYIITDLKQLLNIVNI